MARGHDLHLRLEILEIADEEVAQRVSHHHDVRLETSPGLHDRDSYRDRKAAEEVLTDPATALRRLSEAEGRDHAMDHQRLLL
jgi:hypothetical protein